MTWDLEQEVARLGIGPRIKAPSIPTPYREGRLLITDAILLTMFIIAQATQLVDPLFYTTSPKYTDKVIMEV